MINDLTKRKEGKSFKVDRVQESGREESRSRKWRRYSPLNTETIYIYKWCIKLSEILRKMETGHTILWSDQDWNKDFGHGGYLQIKWVTGVWLWSPCLCSRHYFKSDYSRSSTRQIEESLLGNSLREYGVRDPFLDKGGRNGRRVHPTQRFWWRVEGGKEDEEKRKRKEFYETMFRKGWIRSECCRINLFTIWLKNYPYISDY